MIFVLIPLTIFIGIRIGDRKYFFISMMIMVYSMVPFVMVFEGRRPQARELVILALLAAIAVAGRAAFLCCRSLSLSSPSLLWQGYVLAPNPDFWWGQCPCLPRIFF